MTRMISSRFRRTAVAAAGCALGLALTAPAHATIFVLDLTGTVANATYGSFDSMGQHYNTGLLDVGTGTGLPFTVSAGDEVQISLALDGLFTVPGATGYQFFGVNLIDSSGLNPVFLPSPPAPEATTGTVTFSGGTGAALGAPSTNCGNCLTNLYGHPGPVGAFNFTGLFADTFVGDPTLAAPFTVNDVTISYQVNSAAVPEPATWGLMILGFGGLGAALRRRRTQFAHAA
jgi:hypothetical protein